MGTGGHLPDVWDGAGVAECLRAVTSDKRVHSEIGVDFGAAGTTRGSTFKCRQEVSFHVPLT